MRSVFGNFICVNEYNCPKKVLHFPDFSGATLGTPVVVGGSLVQYSQTVTDSGISSAIMDGFFDSGYVLQLQLTADRTIVGADDAAKAADMATLIENSIVSVAGPFGDTVSALYMDTKTRTTAIGATNSAPQNWLRVLRNAPGSSPPSDMKNLYVSYWAKMQVDGADSLATNLDYLHASANAFWRIPFDLKSGGYGGTEGGGDYRVTLRIYEDADGLYWRVRGDNVADNAAVDGVTGLHETFWDVDARSPIPPNNEWVKVEVYIERPDPSVRTYPSAHPNVTTGRTRVYITPSSTMTRTKICDQIGDTQMGVHDLPWTQMFFAGVYCLAGSQINQYVTDLQIWDTSPVY